MNDLIIALIFIFPPVIILAFYAVRFVLTQKSQALLINEKIAPFLFPLFLILFASFKLLPVRSFLEWLGLSSGIVNTILIIAIVDNIFLFLVSHNRVRKIVQAYIEFLKQDTLEFALVVLLSLLSAIVTFFKTRGVYESPALWAGGVFMLVLFFLPLILYHYRDLEMELKWKANYGQLTVSLLKLVFYFFCPILFINLVKVLLNTGSSKEIIIVFSLWILELLVLFLFWKKIIAIPKAITDSWWYKNYSLKLKKLSKNSLLYLYNHIEIAAVILLFLIVSWPMAMARIEEYRNWRSNFPMIKKALPVVGMQGTMIILLGDNFGTTGLGIPGKIVVGNKELMTPEWNDHKIMAVVPVPPPQGELYIKKNFKWKAKSFVAESNRFNFTYFDWTKANDKDIENFLEMLKKQYREGK